MVVDNVLFFEGFTKPVGDYACAKLLLLGLMVFSEPNIPKPLSVPLQSAMTSPATNNVSIAQQAINTPEALIQTSSGLLAKKSRYNAGLVCQDKGWEFCATWAKSRRSPGSRIA
ncbi:hypothetical protein ACVBIL_10850 [Shewanella sp. 125m-7]